MVIKAEKFLLQLQMKEVVVNWGVFTAFHLGVQVSSYWHNTEKDSLAPLLMLVFEGVERSLKSCER